MSVKKIIFAILGLAAVGVFATAVIISAVNTKDRLDLQEVELKSRGTEIKELNVQYDSVNKKLDDALKQKNTSQSEIDRLKEEKDAADKERERLKAELQAKAESKSKIKLASVSSEAKTASTVSTDSGSIQDIIIAAANKYGVSVDRALRVGSCESTGTPGKFDANALNLNYSEEVNGVNYHPSGLFQHLANYWPARAAKYGYAGSSVFDPVANANVTMAMWRDGASGLWECN